ncbi:Hypothetical protein ORPV_422 [Orpheovirus IHUMI-LCC2]|uniref:Ankyrin-repeat protein n=1 Tax=Orpheovirus IHUMI-LCC2 TaxID=2023057 RepID=A0A2I2L461_9VIRU|nr:Hypothetical protein ORPV_422 [Orpheovirus IHUMI-LCC2]SNW62326.1 Hypothetical protein ORPV_422 [Orpheovirus IHUMI-LCC2]
MDSIPEDIIIYHLCKMLSQRYCSYLLLSNKNLWDIRNKYYKILFPPSSYKDCCKEDKIISFKDVMHNKYPWFGIKYASKYNHKLLVLELLKNTNDDDEYKRCIEVAYSSSYYTKDEEFIECIEEILLDINGDIDIQKICYYVGETCDKDYIENFRNNINSFIKDRDKNIKLKIGDELYNNKIEEGYRKGLIFKSNKINEEEVKLMETIGRWDSSYKSIWMYYKYLKYRNISLENIKDRIIKLWNGEKLFNIVSVRLPFHEMKLLFNPSIIRQHFDVKMSVIMSLSKCKDINVISYVVQMLCDSDFYLNPTWVDVLRSLMDSGNLEILKHYREKLKRQKLNGSINNINSIYVYGHKDVVQYLKTLGFTKTKKDSFIASY